MPSNILKLNVDDFQFNLLVAQTGALHEIDVQKKAQDRAKLKAKRVK